MQINEEKCLRDNVLIIWQIIWQGSLSAILNVTFVHMSFRRRAGIDAIQTTTKLKRNSFGLSTPFATRFMFVFSCWFRMNEQFIAHFRTSFWTNSGAKELIPMFYMILKRLIMKQVVYISFPGGDRHLPQLSTGIIEGRRKIRSSFHCWWSEYPEWYSVAV